MHTLFKINFCVVITASCILNSCKKLYPVSVGPTFITYSQINIVGVDGSNHRVLAADDAWEPLVTSRSIIFTQDNFKIYSVNYDGSNKVQLYPNISWAHYTLTPDSGKVLLTSYLFQNNSYSNDLYLMNIDGSGLQQLAPVRDVYGYPHLSPNLDEIVFCRYGSVGTINVDGTALRFVRSKTDSTFCDYALYVDQTHIVYFERGNLASSIRLFDKISGEDKLVAVFSSGFPAHGRALFGNKLLFADRDTIKILDVYTSIMQTPVKGYYASFSSTGARIVYGDNKTIWTANSDGSNQLTIYTEKDSVTSISYPQFSADDRSIIFLTGQTIEKF